MALVTITNYVYTPASKTVAFTGWPSIQLQRIVSIKNLTRDTWVFKPTDTTNYGGSVATNVLTYTTLDAGLAAAAAADALLIVYDAPVELSIACAPTTVAGNNLLLTTAGTGSLDLQAFGMDFRSISMSIASTFSQSAGQVEFECSEDNVNWSAWHVVDKDYAFMGAVYRSHTPRGAPAAHFESGVPARYVRARISTASSSGLTVTLRLSTKERAQEPGAQRIPQDRITKTTSNAGASAQLVAAPGSATATRLQLYFVGMVWSDGGSATTPWDCWITSGTAAGPGTQKLCCASQALGSGGDKEGDAIYPVQPIPCGVGNGIWSYLNNGTMNLYYTLYTFSAP